MKETTMKHSRAVETFETLIVRWIFITAFACLAGFLTLIFLLATHS